MRLIFVRHGEPDYENKCLTPLGYKQAEVLVDRLKDEGITEIHTSTLERAIMTAEPIAKKLGLDITKHEFINEVGGASTDGTELPEGGHPWRMARALISQGIDLCREDWADTEPYCHSKLTESYSRVADGIDAFLAELGYVREGRYYRVCRPTKKNVALFSHCGSSTAALCRILNIAFPYALGNLIVPKHTAVTVLRFSGNEGDLIAPVIEVMNDAAHINGIETDGLML